MRNKRRVKRWRNSRRRSWEKWKGGERKVRRKCKWRRDRANDEEYEEQE
jgi:hypothetical protein